MKAKHLYVLSLVITIGCICASAAWIAELGARTQGVVRISIPSALPHPQTAALPVPEETKDLERILLLAVAKGVPTPPVKLSAFGYQEVKEPSGRKKGMGLQLTRTFSHSVTFAFCAGTKSFCVVDGTFYPEGAVLPGGAKILKVLPQKILIEEAGTRKWFPVGAGIKESREQDHQTPGETK